MPDERIAFTFHADMSGFDRAIKRMTEQMAATAPTRREAIRRALAPLAEARPFTDFHREWLHVMDTQHPHTPQETDMPNNQRRHREQMGVLDQIHDTLTEIRDRLPEREVACGDVWRDETERPCTRPSGHDGNHVDKVGTIWANPEPAPADVDPDGALGSVVDVTDLYAQLDKAQADFARMTKEWDGWRRMYEAAVAARALRNAADALDGGIGTSTARFGMDPHDYDSRADYGYAVAEADLRDRADRIEREGAES